MRAYINSEFAALKAVLLGFIDNFKIREPVNSVQRYYYKNDPPHSDLMIEQYEMLVEIFENFGVQVYRYDHKPVNMGRPFCRDAFTVIHDTLFICSMKNRPTPDVTDLTAEIETPVMQIDKGIVEGGDILIDKDILYIGMGERTELTGLQRIKEQLNNKFEIQPLQLKSEILHLDVVLNLLGKKTALIYPAAFSEESLDILKKRYNLFEINESEQFALGTNLVSLTPETVISEKRLIRINDFLKKEGFNLITTDYSEVSKLGGSFRCSTCPLIREKF